MTERTKAAKNLQSRKSSACRFRSLRRKNTPRTPHRRHQRVFTHAVEATSWSIRSTSERKNSRIGKVMLSRQREFCSAVRLFVPTRAERNLFRLCRVQPNLVHLCTNSHTTILFCSRCPAYSDRQSRKRKVNLFLSL